jgi:hypothetical protein
MQARSAKTSTRPPKPSKALAGKPDDPEQSKAFIEKAREIGADEKRSAADKLMGRMAKMKPAPKKSAD